MATNAYCTAAELKAELRIADAADDTRLDAVVDAASRVIDEHCGRFFWETASQSRYYTADQARKLYIDDATAVTAVAVDPGGDGTYEESWAVTTDYLLGPYNAPTDVPARPYTWIEVPGSSGRRFPCGVPKGVKVTGTFGWDAVPDQVQAACLLQGAFLFKRADATFGVAPVPLLDGGAVRLSSRLDATAQLLLAPFVREPVMVG